MTKKRFTYLNTSGWNKDGFLNVMNGLNEKNKKLQKENEKLKNENENLKVTIQAREVLIEVCERKFRELGYIITVDDDGYVIE